jgi:undecaprenyl diphosphate synthase
MPTDTGEYPNLEQVKFPRHVAIVMDGNGRWAKQKLLPRSAGHREGVKAVQRVVKACLDRGVEVLTLFAFSSENWRRPEKEVNLLMELFLTTLRSELRRLRDSNVRLRFIGEHSALPLALQEWIKRAESQTAVNTSLTLVIAANYGGRWDITQAACQLVREAQEGRLHPDEISYKHVQVRLCLHDLPEPDLFIRTGGEQRISNFLLWQLAYTELYFTERLWPDYDAGDFEAACLSFARRQRRFGRTSEQVEQGDGA